MPVKFPITECPHCKHSQFKVNATSAGIVEVIFNATGDCQTFNQVSTHIGKYRKNWACARCNTQLFTMEDCH